MARLVKSQKFQMVAHYRRVNNLDELIPIQALMALYGIEKWTANEVILENYDALLPPITVQYGQVTIEIKQGIRVITHANGESTTHTRQEKQRSSLLKEKKWNPKNPNPSEKMMMLMAVVQAQDADVAESKVRELGVSVTRLPSVGAFLGRRNANFFDRANPFARGRDAQNFQRNCRQRIEYIAVPLKALHFRSLLRLQSP